MSRTPSDSLPRAGKRACWSDHHKTLALLMLFVLLAFVLRLYSLEGQSFWSDEGLSLYRARLPLAEVLQNAIVVDGVVTQDTNPPFYFLLLHLWWVAAGDAVFVLRFLGVAGSMLAVPLLYGLGKVTYSRPVGIAAALLLAISPFHVWQSQVLRNYGLLLTLNLLSLYGLFRFLLRREGHARPWRWLALWAGAALLGIYTHYFAFFILAFALLALLVDQVALRRPRLSPRLLLAGGLAGVLLLPALSVAVSRFRAGRQIDFYRVPLTGVLRHAGSAFSVGMSPTLDHPLWRVLPVVALALLGAVLAWRRRRAATLLLLGYQVVPLGVLLALSTINPLYNGTRHLLIGLPPFLLFVAAGMVLPPRERAVPYRRLAFTLGLLVMAGQIAWLSVQFHGPRLVRDDIRAAAVYLTEAARPQDVVVLHDTLIKFTFDYYYAGAAPVVAVPRYGEMDEAAAIAALQGAGRKAERVWFLTEPQPRTGFDRQLLAQWADVHWMRVFERRFPAMWLRVNLRAYLPHFRPEAMPAAATAADVSWPGALRLHGYQIPDVARAGSEWWLRLFLSRLEAERRQYTFILRLLDASGREWARVGDPLDGGAFPPAVWPRGTLIDYAYDVSLPAGLPAGAYQVWMYLVDTESGETVARASGSAEVRLPDVLVQPASCDADPALWPAHVARKARLGSEVVLRGYSALQQEYRPGHLLSLDLLWCAQRRPQADYRWRLQLVDGDAAVVAEASGPMTRPDYPPTSWEAGKLIAGKAELVVPATATAGTYTVQLSLLPPQGERPLAVNWLLGGRRLTLAEVEVAAWPLVTTLPPIASPLRADFGEPVRIELHGYELSPPDVAAGETATLKLFWRAATAIDGYYDVFVHLTDASGEIIGQADGPPQSGFRPTASWRPGEVIVDERALTVPAELEAGTYRLWVGLYDPDTGARLPLRVNGALQPDGRLLLQTVQVSE